MRGATSVLCRRVDLICISIHAPRAGCDHFRRGDPAIGGSISIHAPRAGCDASLMSAGRSNFNFNPRTPCGVRLQRSLRRSVPPRISIHAPRAGCDADAAFKPAGHILFQSTHPVRGATIFYGISRESLPISIHAPRAGCDRQRRRKGAIQYISIHAPRAGCDRRKQARRIKPFHFNPRTPCGVRPFVSAVNVFPETISIHAPRAGCDVARLFRVGSHVLFQSTHPVRGATARRRFRQHIRHNFNPRTPCGVRRRSAQRAGWYSSFQSTHPVRGATSLSLLRTKAI